MTSKLKCIYCQWETKPYDMFIGGGYLEAFEDAKAHIRKQHKSAQKRYGWKGKSIQECFTVERV